MMNESAAKPSIADLIDISTLQQLQKSFCDMTGMAGGITDAEGVPIIEGKGFSDFCKRYIRMSEKGKAACYECVASRRGIHAEDNKYYICHAGLVDFSAPIKFEDEVIGYFVAGQVATQPLEEEYVREIARKYDIHELALWDAAGRIKVLEQKEIERAQSFITIVAGILSDMVYGEYLTRKANADIAATGNMKSGFLANMSHEIRTPMNAVIGMAEMSLRENLSTVAREYITQIKTSGTALLAIINDILDFSKIESGKMDIIPVEYESMSIINDSVNVLNPRLANKDVEFIIDIDPTIPHMLLGDNIRIKQVLINIASNAVKFTNEGFVKISLSYERTAKDRIRLIYDVEDSGTGIRTEDMNKLFSSFEQADSKRNRNAEGTGLGLAISRQLVRLMGGEVTAESEFGKGSKFSFFMGADVTDSSTSITIKNVDAIKSYGYFSNKYIAKQYEKDCEAIGVRHELLTDVESLLALKDESESFVFVEKSMYTDSLKDFMLKNENVTFVLLADYNDNSAEYADNIYTIKKPLYVLNQAQVYNREKEVFDNENSDSTYDYIAPNARILIVDDNPINLTVAEGLLDPLGMQIDTAISGQEAINKINAQAEGYHIVFLDHMMPGMDGIETAKAIRAERPDLEDMPIVALTANSSASAKEQFVAAGMNDYVAKPIEVRHILQKIKHLLPADIVEKGKTLPKKPVEETTENLSSKLEIGDLDTDAALKLLGNENLFWKVLEDYYSVIDKKTELIKRYESLEDWPAYTIEVHALKSASRQIGANELADLAMEMEKAGNEKNGQLIHSATDSLLVKYQSYKPLFAPYFVKEEVDESSKETISSELLSGLLDQMQEAFDNLDMDAMEEVYGQLDSYAYDENGKELLSTLKEAVDGLDMDLGEETIQKFKALC